uniref:Putative programmed cell death protein n=1 Tax=Ornithodoros turicata TaxID=34597 RepID=A0A2R5LI09_9ACAR
MATYLAIPLKKTSEVDIVKPLSNVISANYATADEHPNYTEALVELNKLRLNSTWRTLDKHESSLEIMYRYYDQLTSLESKCPASDIQIPFKWKDAFDKGGFFGGSASLTLSSLAYEKICILFNMAAMQTQIAADLGCDTNDDEAMKTCAKYFQQASGIFQQLKHTAPPVHQDLTPDLEADTVTALQSLMLAQAQESFYHKAAADQMKHAIIAKVASQCEDLYADAARQMGRDSLKNLWEKEWLAVISSKQASFGAIAQYNQAMVCRANKDVGEELSRLQYAAELIRTAESRGGLSFNFKNDARKITIAHDETKKDNDFIYHARIPEVKSLAPIGKAALAKPLPVPEKFSSSGQDLFSALLPVSVSQALQKFDVRKSDIVNGEIAKLRHQTQLLNGFLTSLNLPAALEDTTGSTLPQSIKDKAQCVREKGGIQAIEKLINDLPVLLERNQEILSECERMIREEEDSDNQLRAQFQERWTRTPSDKLNTSLKSASAKYKEIISNAVLADGVVREKFNKHRNYIELLSQPNDGALQGGVPSGSPTASNSPSVVRLRQLMDQVEAIKAEREVIESQLKDSTMDMKPKFLAALTQDGSINEQALSVEMLGESLGPLQKQVADSVSRQEALVRDIQAANSEFCHEKQSKGGNTRESALVDLAAAHDTYMELTANLQEGTKFYNDLTQILLSYQNKLSDFCFARRTEKEELVKDLQQSIINKPTQPTPTPPSHHVAARATQPPPRPPPPTTASAPVTGGAGAAVPPYPMMPQGMPQPHMTYPGYPQYPGYTPYPAVPMPTIYNPYAAPPGYPAGGPPQYQPYPQYPQPRQPYSDYPYPRQQ